MKQLIYKLIIGAAVSFIGYIFLPTAPGHYGYLLIFFPIVTLFTFAYAWMEFYLGPDPKILTKMNPIVRTFYAPFLYSLPVALPTIGSLFLTVVIIQLTGKALKGFYPAAELLSGDSILSITIIGVLITVTGMSMIYLFSKRLSDTQ